MSEPRMSRVKVSEMSRTGRRMEACCQFCGTLVELTAKEDGAEEGQDDEDCCTTDDKR